MISATEALASVMSRNFKPGPVEIPLENSLGRVLATDVFADLDQPPFHRVAMDGIALSRSQLSHTSQLKILGTVAAGEISPDLPEGAVCYEIMTGAALPKGADMVIRYEDIRIENGQAQINCDPTNLSPNVHPQGNDYRKGDKVLSKGTIIRSTTTALLASVGMARVLVDSLPRITILSTGDELVDIDATPAPTQIRWSNGISLRQELVAFGLTEVTVLKVRDHEESMREVMLKSLAESDVLLLTGGVSAGKFDFVPKLLKECRVREVFHKVAQRPGKPLWFGETPEQKFVFGLPGNPVSCLVNLRKYVVPFLTGHNEPKAFLAEEVKFNKNFTYYCPVKVSWREGKLMATPLSGNGSGDFYQLRDSDGFIELRPEQSPFKAGLLSEVYLWGGIHA